MKLNGCPVSVESLLEGAKGYLSALETLAKHPAKQLVEPIGLLASQALELALKAVLLHGGWTERQLISTVGHDLKKAWEEAKKKGLKISWEHRFSVDVLSLSHNSPYLFRYPREKVGAAITEPEVLCKDVQAVIAAVEEHVAN
jgi:hypothetical protein